MGEWKARPQSMLSLTKQTKSRLGVVKTVEEPVHSTMLSVVCRCQSWSAQIIWNAQISSVSSQHDDGNHQMVESRLQQPDFQLSPHAAPTWLHCPGHAQLLTSWITHAWSFNKSSEDDTKHALLKNWLFHRMLCIKPFPSVPLSLHWYEVESDSLA